ncbi:MAG: SprT-like domain-containing protein [Muribaculum sp.]|nr:SprT-like domain-containing protein [Muribaculum sp.]
MRANISFVKDRFDRFNREMFGGELKPIRISINHSQRALGMFKCKGTRIGSGPVAYGDPSISISDLYDMDPEAIEDIIIHEMIHYAEWLHHRGPITEPHGEFFRTHMERINRDFSRHVTVREKLDAQTVASANRETVSVIGVFSDSDGNKFITKIAKSRFFDLHDKWKASGYIVRWYFTFTSRLVSLKRVTVLRYYPLKPELEAHLLHPNSFTTPIRVFSRGTTRYMEADTSAPKPTQSL